MLDTSLNQDSYSDYIEAWKKAAKDLTKLDGFIAKYHEYPKFDEVLIDISKDSAKANLKNYAKIWLELNNRKYLSDELRSRAVLPIAIGFAKTHNPETKKWFSMVNQKYYSENAWRWLLRTDIYDSDFKNYIYTYDNLPKNIKKQEAWKYWLAYSYNKTNNKSKAKEIFKKLANKRRFSYYTLLAADALDQSYDLGTKKVSKISQDKISHLLKDKDVIQAIDLYKINQYKDSAKLWRWVIKQKFNNNERSQIPGLAQLAWMNQMYYQAIFSMGMMGIDDHFELLFPNPFAELVAEQSQKYSLQKSLILSIMRRESLFYKEASSSVGAKDLMQVIVPTAKFISKKYRLKGFESEINRKIYNPDTNIMIGSANLDFLDDLFHNNLILSIAAYNAGPGNVAKWLTYEEIPAKQWIERLYHLVRPENM